MNPLLDFSGLPRFPEIKPEHVTPAVDHLLAENRAWQTSSRQTPAMPGWDSLCAASMEDANERLSRAWGQVAHLNAVMNSPNCARCTTRTCPRSPPTTPTCRRTWRCSANSKSVAQPAPGLRRSAAPEEIIENEAARFPPGRRRAAPRTRSRASRRSRKSCRRCRPSSRRTCSMPPTISV